MSRPDAEALLAALCDAWEGQYGSLGRLEEDLGRMSDRLFKPIKRERSLREVIARDVQASGGAELPPGLRVDVGSGHLISPEGRLFIQVLEETLHVQRGEAIRVSPQEVMRAERLLLDLYRDWCRERLHRVVELEAGESAPLLPGPIGLVLVLVLEHAVGADRAVVQPGPNESDEYEQSLVESIAAFARALEPGAAWNDQHFGLYGGYVVSEAARRLPGVVLEPPGRRRSGGPAKRLYLKPGTVGDSLAFVASDLKRRKYSPVQITEALIALVETHRASATAARASDARQRWPVLFDALGASVP
jgi:hypothetical protein